MIIDVASLFLCYATIFPEHTRDSAPVSAGSMGARVERRGEHGVSSGDNFG